MSFPAKPSRPGGAYPKRRTTPGLQLRTQREQRDGSQPFGLFLPYGMRFKANFLMELGVQVLPAPSRAGNPTATQLLQPSRPLAPCFHRSVHF